MMTFPWLGSTSLLLLWVYCTAVDVSNDCGPPPRRENEEPADLSLKESYSHGETLLYNCRPGYIKLGRFRLQCNNGEWIKTSRQVECKKKPCGHPGDLQSGSFELVEGDGFYFGARVVYRCDEGFQMLSRTNFRVCRADGWSNELPHCEIIKCFPVKEPKNGRIIMTGIMDLDQDFLYGHLLRFECADHFKIKGSEQLVCTAHGNWSAPVPECVEITCQPEYIPHGHIISERKIYKDGDQMQIFCDHGFKIADRKEATCTRNGWNIRLECIEIVCQPPHVEDGDFRRKKLQYSFEDEIEIVCDDGFQTSSRISTCTDQGWQPPPICIPKNCGYVPIPNGRYYYNEQAANFPKRVGSRVYYTCNHGFLPPNKRSWDQIVCTKAGWDPEPKCLKQCEHRNNFRNGKFLYAYAHQPFIEGNTISYECNGGYYPANQRIIVACTKNGWSPAPRCGTYEEIYPSPCENTPPVNGFFVNRKDRFSLYEKANYGCQSGFTTPDGQDRGEIVCQSEGWRPEPMCIKTCLKPTEENAVFGKTKAIFFAKEILQYKCKEGFETTKGTSDGKTQCKENGWDPHPICLPIECEGLTLENGRVEKREDKYVNGDVVHFSCQRGRTRVGPDSAQCYYFGWYPQPPACKVNVKPCEQPNSIIDHGLADGDLHEEYQHGETVVYECDAGFAMIGSNTIECVDGEWTSLPSCTEEPKNCERPPSVPYGLISNVDASTFKHNETVKYECRGKLAVPESIAARCLHGEWEVPSCMGKCTRPKNAKFVPQVPLKKEFDNGSTANYSCRSGVYATQCIAGKWTPEPECKELCPPPPQLPNAVNMTERRNYRSGEEVSFKCMEHFVLQGPQKIMCDGGRWQTPPRCVDTRCGVPPSIPNGEVESGALRKYSPGETVEYVCHEGFETKGGRSAICENAEWSELPSCKEKSCQTPSVISHASYPKKVKQQYKAGETVEYKCHPGFAAEGPETITCRRGEWSHPSTCEDATCKQPPVVVNADIIEERSESYLPGHELHYKCYDGFQLSGSDTIRCENKEWSNPPTCEDVRCFPPPRISNGQIYGTLKERYLPREKVRYRCLPSYSLFGTPTVTCLKKEWTSPPVCKAAAGKCDRPPVIDNGDILESLQYQYLSGDKVHYKCQNLYIMEGNAEVSCKDGHWSEPPTCIVPCIASEEDMRNNNIRLRWTGGKKLYSESGDSAEFVCIWGYHHDPSSPALRSQCRDGSFDYPRCV